MLKKICGFLMGLIILLLAVIAGVLVVPNLFGCKSMAVISGSMEPNIPVGSIVVIKEVEPATLKPQDVITYSMGADGKTLVTHRVVSVDTAAETVITKGDANETEDGTPIPFAGIVGKMLFHVPLLGYLSMYIKTPLGIAFGCGLVIILILLNFLPEIFSKEEEKEEKSKDLEKVSKE